MAVSVYLSAVNQKLLFAKQLLAMTASIKLSARAGLKDSHQVSAICQSVALQLYQAWHWHLLDIASNYKLPDPQLATGADKLVSLLEQAGKCPAEATEMQNLADDKSSWAVELFSAHAGLYELPSIRKAEMDADRLPMIAVGTVDERNSVDWRLETAENWLAQMQELVERQRDMMVEF
ncbi:MAG: hypothetical protein HN817_07780 [Porticoccaceae bacterium]|nr:hypothetical protein [Porticoccaceae bacterium]MBT7375810.1 hypothetical protein [Porticoccaceae bacterium]